MPENIYDIQEVKALLDNEIENGIVEELTLGLTSELNADKKDVRQSLFDIKMKLLGQDTALHSNTHISTTPVSIVSSEGSLSITVNRENDYEKEVEKLKCEALDEYGKLNPKITDCHLNYRIVPLEPGNQEEIINIINNPLSNGLVNEMNVNISSKIIPEENKLEEIRGCYKKYNGMFKGKDKFYDDHFAIFEGPHYRSEDGELRFSIQESSGEELQKSASKAISEYLKTMDPKISNVEISLLVTPERYGR